MKFMNNERKPNTIYILIYDTPEIHVAINIKRNSSLKNFVLKAPISIFFSKSTKKIQMGGETISSTLNVRFTSGIKSFQFRLGPSLPTYVGLPYFWIHELLIIHMLYIKNKMVEKLRVDKFRLTVHVLRLFIIIRCHDFYFWILLDTSRHDVRTTLHGR